MASYVNGRRSGVIIPRDAGETQRDSGRRESTSTPLDRVVDAFRTAGCDVRDKGNRRDGQTWRVSCPACGHLALVVTGLDDGRVVLHCHDCHGWTVGRSEEHERVTAGILALVGLTFADLRPDGGTDMACPPAVRAWTADWLVAVTSWPWPKRRRATFERVAVALASFHRQAAGEAFVASERVIGQRAGRGRMATRNALVDIMAADWLDRLTVGRIRAGVDGVVAVPSSWRLKMCALDQYAVPPGRNMQASLVLVQDAHFIGRSAGWVVRPGGDVDVALGGWTYVETLAAIMALDVSGASEWTVAAVTARRGCSRTTASNHVERFVRLDLVRVVRAGGRGRGNAAVYALDAVGLAAFVERARGLEALARERVLEQSRDAVAAVGAFWWRSGDVASLRSGVVERDAEPAALTVVDGKARRAV